jgi:hypothetical protein
MNNGNAYDNLKEVLSIRIVQRASVELDGTIRTYRALAKILSGNILERVENYDEIAIITIYTGGKYNIENK